MLCGESMGLLKVQVLRREAKDVAPWWNADTRVLGTRAFGHPGSSPGGATKIYAGLVERRHDDLKSHFLRECGLVIRDRHQVLRRDGRVVRQRPAKT